MKNHRLSALRHGYELLFTYANWQPIQGNRYKPYKYNERIPGSGIMLAEITKKHMGTYAWSKITDPEAKRRYFVNAFNYVKNNPLGRPNAADPRLHELERVQNDLERLKTEPGYNNGKPGHYFHLLKGYLEYLETPFAFNDWLHDRITEKVHEIDALDVPTWLPEQLHNGTISQGDYDQIREAQRWTFDAARKLNFEARKQMFDADQKQSPNPNKLLENEIKQAEDRLSENPSYSHILKGSIDYAKIKGGDYKRVKKAWDKGTLCLIQLPQTKYEASPTLKKTGYKRNDSFAAACDYDYLEYLRSLNTSTGSKQESDLSAPQIALVIHYLFEAKDEPRVMTKEGLEEIMSRYKTGRRSGNSVRDHLYNIGKETTKDPLKKDNVLKVVQWLGSTCAKTATEHARNDLEGFCRPQ